jgi:hypothetical protein
MGHAAHDLDALLARMRERRYAETSPVLASYWLSTVCAAGHKLAWWNDLHRLLKQTLHQHYFDEPSRAILNDVDEWIQHNVLGPGKEPEAAPSRIEPYRANLKSEWLAPYIARLMNEWLPAEVAGLLINDFDPAATGNDIPVLAIGKALERLLVRERLSPETLERFLEPGLLHPEYVYPAEAEMLRDVVLCLLGRTSGPPLPVMPATLLAVAEQSPFSEDFKEAVRRAFHVVTGEGEEIHVPIPREQALKILYGTPLRISSIIATMDGRWWESENLESGERNTLIYKPGGRLRIDYTAGHARLLAPRPDTQLRWSGSFRFPEPFEIFGREWHATRWETDGDRTWLHLEFSRALPIAEIQPAAGDASFRRSRPASVDMAWTAVAAALEASVGQRNREPIERMRRSDFIPLGRALVGLVEAMQRRPKREAIETQLRAVRYHDAELAEVYGRVPWRVLPETVRSGFLKRRKDTGLMELLNQAFEAVPEPLAEAAPPSRAA